MMPAMMPGMPAMMPGMPAMMPGMAPLRAFADALRDAPRPIAVRTAGGGQKMVCMRPGVLRALRSVANWPE
eukprot:gene32545-28386_t